MMILAVLAVMALWCLPALLLWFGFRAFNRKAKRENDTAENDNKNYL